MPPSTSATIHIVAQKGASQASAAEVVADGGEHGVGGVAGGVGEVLRPMLSSALICPMLGSTPERRIRSRLMMLVHATLLAGDEDLAGDFAGRCGHDNLCRHEAARGSRRFGASCLANDLPSEAMTVVWIAWQRFGVEDEHARLLQRLFVVVTETFTPNS